MMTVISFEKGIIQTILYWIGKSWIKFLTVNLLIIFAEIFYILLRMPYINPEVPFFYTQPWGTAQLAPKYFLFFIPFISIIIEVVCLYFYHQSTRYYWQLANRILLLAPTIVNTILLISLIRIIFIASIPFDPLVKPELITLLPPFLMALVLTLTFTPKAIEFLKEKNIVTNPSIHKHPSMILKRPSARGGGLIFTIFFVITSIFFAGFSMHLNAIYIGALLLALLGILDDYQNTNPKSKLTFFENPLVRLISLFLIVLIPIYMGIRINFINNPFDGVVNFSQYQFVLNGTSIPWLSIIITAFWIVWVLNVLSWSNGVDGQYGGIVGIAFIVISILALRFEVLTDTQLSVAKITAAGAGAAVGLSYYNWYPSRIMWGFGAVSAGLVISLTSILIGSKIATSTLIILLPFIDAVVIFIRRVLQKKNPLRGDKSHLHHLLMTKGWGIRRIATFYWIATALFGTLGILTAGSTTALVTLTVIGITAFIVLIFHFAITRRIQETIKRSFKGSFKKQHS